MKRSASAGKKKTGSTPRTRLHVRWDETPHREIFLKAEQSMSLNSPLRAKVDTDRFLLKRRLPDCEGSVHVEYVGIEAAWITEMLRHLRDQYRAHFDGLGRKPIAEMHWEVFRRGVMDWAITALQSAAENYIAASNVDPAKWYSLFDPVGAYYDIFPSEAGLTKSAGTSGPLSATIRSLLPQTAFDEVFDGGPFGREYQIHITRSLMRTPFLGGLETVDAVIHRRLRAWDEAKPWSEGLATLFEATQEEVRLQFAALDRDAWQAELKFVDLSAFERIAYDHFRHDDGGQIAGGATRKADWPSLMRKLDEAGIAPDDALRGLAREVLMAARQKSLKIQTWQECYQSTARLNLQDDISRNLRREMTRSIDNTVRHVGIHMAKVYGVKPDPRVSRVVQLQR